MQWTYIPGRRTWIWTYTRRSKNTQDVFRTPYLRLIYVQSLGGSPAWITARRFVTLLQYNHIAATATVQRWCVALMQSSQTRNCGWLWPLCHIPICNYGIQSPPKWSGVKNFRKKSVGRIRKFWFWRVVLLRGAIFPVGVFPKGVILGKNF